MSLFSKCIRKQLLLYNSQGKIQAFIWNHVLGNQHNTVRYYKVVLNCPSSFDFSLVYLPWEMLISFKVYEDS